MTIELWPGYSEGVTHEEWWSGGGGDGGNGGGSKDQYGGWVDSQGMYHGPTDGTVSSGGGWIWQSGTSGFQSDGTLANGIWVKNPDVDPSQCGKKPIIPQDVNEEAIWKDILKDWAESHPNDFVAQQILTKHGLGRDVHWFNQIRGGVPTTLTAPAWIGETGLGITGEPAQRLTGYEDWRTREEPIYEELPGETVGLRPMGGQLSLTADQMEQLQYYYGWLETGQPTTAKGWMQSMAYRIPNKWTDYLAMSEAAMPWKSAPKARVGAAQQR